MIDNLPFQLELVFRIFLAMLSGVMIGLERENRNKDAGIKTHALVAIGAAISMIISKYGFYDRPGGDGARLAAQVISGIGFIGAGVIFVKRDVIIRGLTTAAGLWVTAAIALATGAGMYFISILSTFLVVIFNYGMYSENVSIRKPKEATLRLIYKDRVRTTHILKTLTDLNIRIIHEKIFHDFENNITQLDVDIEMPQDMTVRQLQKIAGSFDDLTSFECAVYE